MVEGEPPAAPDMFKSPRDRPARVRWRRAQASLPRPHLYWLLRSSAALASRCSPVGVMESVQDWAREHRAVPWGRGRAPPGHELIDPLMRAVPVEIAAVFAEHSKQVALAKYEHVVEALATHTAQEALAESVRFGRPHGRLQDPRADAAGDSVKVAPVFVVAPLRVSRSASVTNDEAWSHAERCRTPQLLRGPRRARIVRDSHRQDLART